jgi:hypothetical protein
MSEDLYSNTTVLVVYAVRDTEGSAVDHTVQYIHSHITTITANISAVKYGNK